MKIYIRASLILGLLSVGVLAQIDLIDDEGNSTDVNTTTTDTPETSSITTPSPISTTTLTPISTTLTPNPQDPEEGNWNVTEGNITCIKLDATIQFHIIYEQIDEKYDTATLNVPKGAKTKGSSCENNTLVLTFGLNSSLELNFVKENSKVWAKTAVIKYTLNNETFPNAKHLGESIIKIASNLTLFEASEGKSYLCKDGAKINFDNTTVSFANVQVEAFKNSTSSDFSDSEECKSDEKINDIVPIAVGCALAALVIIVLIAYLVGRQRTRQRGYQSV